MKKYHLYLWLLALVGLVTSCSQDDNADMLQTTDSNTVRITASLPEDFAQIGTRALPTAPDESHQLRCIIEVWSRDATPVIKYREEKARLTGENLTFEFKIDDGTYDCLFWADFIRTDAESSEATLGGFTYTHYSDRYYMTNTDGGLKGIVVNTTMYASAFNTDNRDAFFGHEELKKQPGQNKALAANLTRPFAKLTVKEKNAEAFALCKTLTATYTIPLKFNVLAGTTLGTYNVSYNTAPAGNGTGDLTLFSDYILTASAVRETLGDIKLTFTKQDDAEKELQPVTIPTGVPVQRNYKTNASGSLISAEPDATDKATVTVTMDAEWATPGVEHNIASAPKVGDYFYADGTWGTAYINNISNPCIGIVFEVNADGKSGKIVSLDEANLKWSTVGKETGISNTLDGAANVTAVQNWIASDANTDSKTLADFPAFNWCINKNDGGRTWYLPAVEELKILAKNIENVNTALTTLNKTTLGTDYAGWYWSSHEGTTSKQNYAMYLTFKASNGSYEVHGAKTDEYKVRAISVF